MFSWIKGASTLDTRPTVRAQRTTVRGEGNRLITHAGLVQAAPCRQSGLGSLLKGLVFALVAFVLGLVGLAPAHATDTTDVLGVDIGAMITAAATTLGGHIILIVGIAFAMIVIWLGIMYFKKGSKQH